MYGIVSKTQEPGDSSAVRKLHLSKPSTAFDCRPCHPMCIANMPETQICILTIHVGLLTRPLIQNWIPSPFWCWQDNPIQHVQFLEIMDELCMFFWDEAVSQLAVSWYDSTGPWTMTHHHRIGHRAKQEQPAGHYSYLILKFHHVVHHEKHYRMQRDIKNIGR